MCSSDLGVGKTQSVRLLQHLVRLADARCGTDVNAKACAVLLLDARQQGVGGGAAVSRRRHFDAPFLRKAGHNQQHVNQLDADKRQYDAAGAVYQHVAPKQSGSA